MVTCDREEVLSLFSISKPLSAWLVPLGVLVTEGSGSLQIPETAPVPATSTNSPIPMTGFLIIRKALPFFLLVLVSAGKVKRAGKAEKTVVKAPDSFLLKEGCLESAGSSHVHSPFSSVSDY